MGSTQRPTTSRRYTQEQKDQAVRLVRQVRAETGQKHSAVRRVAGALVEQRPAPYQPRRPPTRRVRGPALRFTHPRRLTGGQTPESPTIPVRFIYTSPTCRGWSCWARFRALNPAPDVIVVTAARDVATVRAARRNGALHYLVKPFEASRLIEQLDDYRKWRADINKLKEASQADVDRLYGRIGGPATASDSHSRAEKPTAQLVLDALRATAQPLTADEVATKIGVNRPTAQRYLDWLHEHGHVERHLRYGTAGRPSHRYSAK